MAQVDPQARCRETSVHLSSSKLRAQHPAQRYIYVPPCLALQTRTHNDDVTLRANVRSGMRLSFRASSHPYSTPVPPPLPLQPYPPLLACLPGLSLSRLPRTKTCTRTCALSPELHSCSQITAGRVCWSTYLASARWSRSSRRPRGLFHPPGAPKRPPRLPPPRPRTCSRRMCTRTRSSRAPQAQRDYTEQADPPPS